jgi:hypothetical protein
MGTKTAGSVVTAGVLAAAFFFAAPAGLAAKERRGATIIVTKLEGTQAAGELIAVRPDSLLLLSEGTDLSIGLADIRSVKIVRPSRSGLLAGIGAATGFLGGAGFILAFAQEDVVENKVKAALTFGLLAGGGLGLVGSVAGKAMGWDTEYEIAGAAEATLARNWHSLRAHSREGVLAGTAPPERSKTGPPPSPEAPRRKRPHRFSLSFSTSLAERRSDSFARTSSFRFLEESAPEAGPFPLSLSGWGDMTRKRTWGPIQASYQLTDRWSAELDLLFLGSRFVGVNGLMTFASGLDGLTYEAWFGTSCRVRLVAVQAGIAYRLVVPSNFNRHSVEVAASAGPAFARSQPFPYDLFSFPASRKTAFCGQVRAAYDFSISPEVFLGVFAGYRLLRTTIVGFSTTAPCVFWATTGPALNLVRSTEVSVPGLPFDASGPFWGIRTGIRF